MINQFKREHIRFYLHDLLKVSYGNTNYREAGAIDSLEFVRFILTLEKEFKIQLTAEDIYSDEFNTIFGLADVILRKLS